MGLADEMSRLKTDIERLKSDRKKFHSDIRNEVLQIKKTVKEKRDDFSSDIRDARHVWQTRKKRKAEVEVEAEAELEVELELEAEAELEAEERNAGEFPEDYPTVEKIITLLKCRKDGATLKDIKTNLKIGKQEAHTILKALMKAKIVEDIFSRYYINRS